MNVKHLSCAVLLLLLMQASGALELDETEAMTTPLEGQLVPTAAVAMEPDGNASVEREQQEEKEAAETDKAMEEHEGEKEAEPNADEPNAKDPQETETEAEPKPDPESETSKAAPAIKSEGEVDSSKEAGEAVAEPETGAEVKPITEIHNPNDAEEPEMEATMEPEQPKDVEKSTEAEQTTEAEKPEEPADVEEPPEAEKPLHPEPTKAAEPAIADYQDDAAAPVETTVAPPVPQAVNISSECYTCSSYPNGTCLKQPREVQKCPKKEKPCYTLYKRETQLITRGCAAHLTQEEDKFCRTNTTLCRLCDLDLCNREIAVTAGVAQLVVTLTIWLTCLVAVMPIAGVYI